MKKRSLIFVCVLLILTTAFVFAAGEKEKTSKRPTIRVMWTDNFEPPTGRMLEYVEDLIDVNVEFISAGPSDYLQKTNTMIAGEDFPDLMQLRENTEATLREWLNNDYILVLDDYIDDYPNVKKAIMWGENYVLRDGHYVGIPKIYAHHPHTMYYRKDLLDKYGLSVPETIQEFYDTIKIISHGEGINGLTANGLQYLEWILGAYTGGATWTQIRTWVPRDGEIVDTVVTDEMREALRLLNKMYRENIIDKEFAIKIPHTKYQERFITGKVPVLSAHIESGNAYDKLKLRTEEMIPGAKVIAAPHPVGPIGKLFVHTRNANTVNMHISKNSKNPEKILELLDFLYSDEGHMFNQYGILDVHYNIDKNGEIKQNWEEIAKDTLTAADPLSKWRWLSNIQAGVFPANAVDREIQKLLFDYNQKFPTEQYVQGFTSNNDIKYSPVLQQMAEEWLIAFIKGEKNLDTDWETWKESYGKAGYNIIKKEVNEYAKNNPELIGSDN